MYRIDQTVKKLTRVNIAPSTLMAFAGELFTEEIERRSRYNVVQIEVSFVSTRHNSDKLLIKDKYLDPFWLLQHEHCKHDHKVECKIEMSLNLFSLFILRWLSFLHLQVFRVGLFGILHVQFYCLIDVTAIIINQR